MKHETPLISVIIPIYNAEKYITRAVDSIKAQTYKNWNLVLVDDGSIDTSYSICKKLEESDSRIRVFHKRNGGEASARNFGLEHANGEYICYVDADDHVSPNLLDDYIGEYPVDMSICGLKVKWGDKTSIINVCDGIYTDLNILSALSQLEILPVGSSCNKLYKRSIIENSNLRFPENQNGIGIDHVFNWQYFQKCKIIRAINKPNYIYEENPNSLTHDNSKSIELFVSTRLQMMKILYHHLSFIKDKSIRGKCQKVYNTFFSDCIIRPLYIHSIEKATRTEFLQGYKDELNKVDYNVFGTASGVFNKLLSLTFYMPVGLNDLALKRIFMLKRLVKI